jgi:hypothetical protein
LPAAPVGENIGGLFLQRGCRAAPAGHRAPARSAAPAGLGQRRLAGRLRRLRGRADELSDVDLQVDDGHVAATFGAVEAALAAASPIGGRLVMPMPTWHGHAQRFYRLRDTAEFTAVDVVRVPAVRPAPVLQPDRAPRPSPGPVRPGRGRPARPPRPGELAATLAREVAGIRERLAFTLPLVAKEVRRGDALAALGLWHRHVLAPLVTLYRVRHTPPATISAPATPATTCPPRSRRRWPSWRS